MEIFSFNQFREAFDEVLRGRGYDLYAADEEVYEELLDDLVNVLREHSL